MSTNRQRREAAKRKLQRRIERAMHQQKQRKKIKRYSALFAATLAIIACIIGGYLWQKHAKIQSTVAGKTPSPYPTIDCYYPTEQQPHNNLARKGTPPHGHQPRNGIIKVLFTTSNGAIPVVLDRKYAPCGVASFAGLINQKFFDNTHCHREVKDQSLTVLQCGDPTATGRGGSGFSNPQEKANFLSNDPANPGAKKYSRGLLALAGASSPNGVIPSGSQFFFVIKDSALPADYPVLGTITPQGLTVLDRILTQGFTPDPQTPHASEGKPTRDVEIISAAVVR